MRFPVDLKPNEFGGFDVAFSDIPKALTQGDNRQDALDMAADVLEPPCSSTSTIALYRCRLMAASRWPFRRRSLRRRCCSANDWRRALSVEMARRLNVPVVNTQPAFRRSAAAGLGGLACDEPWQARQVVGGAAEDEDPVDVRQSSQLDLGQRPRSA